MLHAQLTAAAEQIYKRKIGEQKIVDAQMHAAKGAMKQELQGLGLGKGQVKMPAKPGPVVASTPSAMPGSFTPPKRDATQDRLFDLLAQAMIDQRRKAMAYDDEDLFDDLDAKQQGRLAARWMLAVPPEVKDVPAARGEALRVIGAMLGNDVEVIKNLLQNNIEVVVIPRDKGMTALEQFKTLAGKETHDGRGWEPVRGVGNVKNVGLGSELREYMELKALQQSGKGAASIVAIDPKKGRIYTAVTEENLLGGLTTAPGGGCYDTGYSTTSHEFAHSIHGYGLTDADRATIQKAYDMRLRQYEGEEWVDGPRKVGNNTCYAAQTVWEYFAQLSNAWLGANTGNDPYTGRPRHNGKQWVIDHEPKMVTDILERVYGATALQGLNPEVVIHS
jgi:hypothetical protein